MKHMIDILLESVNNILRLIDLMSIIFCLFSAQMFELIHQNADKAL
jgi:hypothetical protein